VDKLKKIIFNKLIFFSAVLSGTAFYFSPYNFFLGLVQAAQDGPLASTSGGEYSMSLDIPNLVKVSGIADLNFGSYSGIGSATQSDDVCVYTNNTNGQYRVTARGSGTAFAFTVANGAHLIPYTVRWNNSTGTGGNFSLSTNTQSSTLTGGNSTSQSCGGGANANFEVSMAQAALLNVPAGTYTGVITLIIDPI
jgi:spore coat protein U-like protein